MDITAGDNSRASRIDATARHDLLGFASHGRSPAMADRLATEDRQPLPDATVVRHNGRIGSRGGRAVRVPGMLAPKPSTRDQ